MFETVAIIFVIFLVGIIFYGYSLIMQKPPTKEELHSEKCTLCLVRFPKEQLVERAVGDSKVYYFCGSCIAGLANDASKQPSIGSSEVRHLVIDAGEKHRAN